MRKRSWIPVTALLALFVVPNVYADETTAYMIHFPNTPPNTSQFVAPAGGSFVYDSTTNQFLSFTVQWAGYTFDFTNAANNPEGSSPSPCFLGLTGPQATLAFLTVCTTSGNATYVISVTGDGSFRIFYFMTPDLSFFFKAVIAIDPATAPLSCSGSYDNDGCGPIVTTPTSMQSPPYVGIAPGQIIRIIAGPVYVPPGVPVEANLGFVNVNGANIGPFLTETLTQGLTATLDLNADTLQLPGRILVQPAVTVVNPNGLPSAAAAGSAPAVFIPEVTEVFDTATGFGRVLIPGDTEFAAHPTFAFQGLALGQTMQLIVSAFPNTACSATLGFADVNGNPVGATKQVNLQPGQTDSLELHADELGPAPGQRKEIQPLVSPLVSAAAVPTNSACQATSEVFDSLTGRTWTYQPGGRELPAVR